MKTPLFIAKSVKNKINIRLMGMKCTKNGNTKDGIIYNGEIYRSIIYNLDRETREVVGLFESDIYKQTSLIDEYNYKIATQISLITVINVISLQYVSLPPIRLPPKFQ